VTETVEESEAEAEAAEETSLTTEELALFFAFDSTAALSSVELCAAILTKCYDIKGKKQKRGQQYQQPTQILQQQSWVCQREQQWAH